MDDVFPSDVKEFIAQHIHSVAQLEMLLTLERDPERLWTAEEITNLLVLQPQMVNQLLADLVRRGFAVSNGDHYRYQPANERAAGLIRQLAKHYQERRVALTTEIFSKPIDFMKAFADAFRLREEK